MRNQVKALLLLLFITTNLLSAQEVWTDRSRILPDKLRQVPTLLTIIHTPNPNYPELVGESESEFKYAWKHSTTICSPVATMKIVEAGSFIWYSPSGWVENVQFDKRETMKRFNCPNGVLQKDQCYTYEKNYRFGNDLYGGDALWYIIAKDANGNLVKGFGIIETEAELKTDQK
jgi:hypothetical protein